MKTLLVGCGYMAKEYAKVLNGMGIDYDVAGRGAESAKAFEEETGIRPMINGIEVIKKEGGFAAYDKAIVAASVDSLVETTKTLVDNGITSILLEKPGGKDPDELRDLREFNRIYNADIFIAYNRRFYKSVEKALEIIEDDGGVESFNFEFTEWAHVIEPLPKSMEIKQNWFLANSSHVVDMAFFMGGEPEEIKCFSKGSLSWHKKASNFAGCGITKNGALFSYCANWNAPGRWGVEILTSAHRLIFRPLEKLSVQNIGSVKIEEVEIDDAIDTEYKPGLYEQVDRFIKDDDDRFMTLEKQCESLKIYEAILDGIH